MEGRNTISIALKLAKRIAEQILYHNYRALLMAWLFQTKCFTSLQFQKIIFGMLFVSSGRMNQNSFKERFLYSYIN